MSVPAEIRAVTRPKNTIVDDNGGTGPNRYSVRQRGISKYVVGKNPQPHNGKVIGHIIDGKFVPVTSKVAAAGLIFYPMVLVHLLRLIQTIYFKTYLKYIRQEK